MRVARPRLTFHALCVLEEAMERACREGKLAPAPQVRLALGYLYSVSDGDDAIHRLFWDELTNRSETNSRTSAGFGRCQHLNAALNAIARAAGMPRDHEYLAARAALWRRSHDKWPAEELPSGDLNSSGEQR